MDNDRIEGFGDLGNASFLLLGAASLVVVLAYLHGGGWRVLTDSVLGIVSGAYAVATTLALFAAAPLFLAALFGAPEARAVRLIWALILTAWHLVSEKVFFGDNRLTRFAEHFRIREP